MIAVAIAVSASSMAPSAAIAPASSRMTASAMAPSATTQPRAPKGEPGPYSYRWPVRPFSQAASRTRLLRRSAHRQPRRVAPVPLRRRHLRAERNAGLRDPLRYRVHPLAALDHDRDRRNERRRVQLLARRPHRPLRSARGRVRDRHRPHRGAVRPRPLLGEARRPLRQSTATRARWARSSTTRRPACARSAVRGELLVAETYDETPLAVPRPGTTCRSCPHSCAGACSTTTAASCRLEHGGGLPAHDPTCVRVRRALGAGDDAEPRACAWSVQGRAEPLAQRPSGSVRGRDRRVATPATTARAHASPSA